MTFRYFIKSSLLLILLLSNTKIKAQWPSTSVLAMRSEISPQPTDLPVTTALTSMHEQKRLLTYLKQLHVPDQLQQYQSSQKFYYRLANVFARLRLYPLAMKCFLKTVDNIDSTGIDTGYLSASSFDDKLIGHQANTEGRIKKDKSKPTSYERIAGIFNDGKTAVAYAMLFHVKQPAPGKRKIFIWGNTGHTFITLIKYNTDSTYTSASFGFYPKKDQLLSATPIAPTTSAVFKDDAAHQWDEVLGKFITHRKFEKILKLTRDFSTTDYNLNNNNCTDFGLQAAALAGINLNHTKGNWPLGGGNNPALTGQAILEGKISLAGADSLQGLMIDQVVTAGGK